jgi:hypothetical protein
VAWESLACRREPLVRRRAVRRDGDRGAGEVSREGERDRRRRKERVWASKGG